MRKQLIFKIPDSATSQEIKTICDLNSQSYLTGYPLYIFPDWEYDVVEISEPVLTWIPNKSIDKDEEKKFVETMKKTKLTINKEE